MVSLYSLSEILARLVKKFGEICLHPTLCRAMMGKMSRAKGVHYGC